MHRIAFTPEAISDLDAIRDFEARRIIGEIETQLTREPTTEIRNRKRLRPNQLAEWELRVGDFRVFYDIVSNDLLVRVVAVGRKDGNQLFIHGKRYEL